MKSSYKRLALKYHPDKNDSPDATAKFQEIGIAYRAIVDHTEQPHPTNSSDPYNPYRDHEEDFFMDLEFSLYAFQFSATVSLETEGT